MYIGYIYIYIYIYINYICVNMVKLSRITYSQAPQYIVNNVHHILTNIVYSTVFTIL